MMPNRVTTEQVAELVELPPDVTDLSPFINTANMMVDEQLVGKGLTDRRLINIELWLSAHFTTIRVERGGLRSSKVDDASDWYQKAGGDGLEFTRYGRQAMALDTTGILKALDGSGTAVFRVI